MADQTDTGPTETAVPIPNAGPPPDDHKPSGATASPSKLPLVGLGARALQILLAFIAMLVMATLNTCGTSFDEFQAFSYLLAAMIFQILWSSAMLVFEALGHFSGYGIVATRNFAFARFIGEFIITFMAFSAAAAGAGVTTALDDQDFCSACNKYCSQAQGAVAMAFLAWAAQVPLLLLSTFIFFAFLQ